MTDEPTHKPPPPQWGEDPLTEYMQRATENRWATFIRLRPEVDRLQKIDSVFDEARKGLINPKAPVSAMLLLRAFAAFRAASENAMAGQVPDSFNAMRACLEAAAYALHVARNPKLQEVWLRRHDDETSLKAQKKAFLYVEVKKSVEAADRVFVKNFDALYQLTIDHGAHPNEMSLTGNSRFSEEDGKREFQMIFLHNDPVQIIFATKNVARVGVCALHLLSDAFPERFMLLSLTDKIRDIKKDL